jgi:hypothetical protein
MANLMFSDVAFNALIVGNEVKQVHSCDCLSMFKLPSTEKSGETRVGRWGGYWGISALKLIRILGIAN